MLPHSSRPGRTLCHELVLRKPIYMSSVSKVLSSECDQLDRQCAWGGAGDSIQGCVGCQLSSIHQGCYVIVTLCHLSMWKLRAWGGTGASLQGCVQRLLQQAAGRHLWQHNPAPRKHCSFRCQTQSSLSSVCSGFFSRRQDAISSSMILHPGKRRENTDE